MACQKTPRLSARTQKSGSVSQSLGISNPNKIIIRGNQTIGGSSCEGVRLCNTNQYGLGVIEKGRPNLSLSIFVASTLRPKKGS